MDENRKGICRILVPYLKRVIRDFPDYTYMGDIVSNAHPILKTPQYLLAVGLLTVSLFDHNNDN